MNKNISNKLTNIPVFLLLYALVEEQLDKNLMSGNYFLYSNDKPVFEESFKVS